jgi:hypothetical protein
MYSCSPHPLDYTDACRYLIKPILLCKFMKQTKNKQTKQNTKTPRDR